MLVLVALYARLFAVNTAAVFTRPIGFYTFFAHVRQQLCGAALSFKRHQRRIMHRLFIAAARKCEPDDFRLIQHPQTLKPFRRNIHAGIDCGARAAVGHLKSINTYARHPGEGRGRAFNLNRSPIPAFAGMTIWLVIDT